MGLTMLKMEMDDGSEVVIPFDFDLSELTLSDLASLAELNAPFLDDVPSEHAFAASFMYLKLKKSHPEVSFDVFGPFFLKVLAEDESVVEVV